MFAVDELVRFETCREVCLNAINGEGKQKNQMEEVDKCLLKT